jgi:hypothetical protein
VLSKGNWQAGGTARPHTPILPSVTGSLLPFCEMLKINIFSLIFQIFLN